MSAGRHIAPSRLADAIAGAVSEREAAHIERHLARCARCAGARQRLTGTRAAMRDIAAQSPPELRWDHIGARIYWTTSSARYAALRQRAQWWRRWPVLAAGGLVTVAVALIVALGLVPGHTHSPAGHRALSRQHTPPPAPVEGPPASTAPVAPLEGVVTFARGPVSLDGQPISHADLFARSIGPGQHLATGAGARLVVQFGRATGFALGSRSALALSRFDRRAVELHIDGTIEVEVSKRAADQTFDVVAGHRRVSVRGTAFRVDNRNRQLDVVCAHGLVVVTGDDDDGEVDLGPGQTVHLWRATLLEHARRHQIDPARLAALERSLAAPLLPAWTQPRALFETSSTLALEAGPGRRVRIDGDDVGSGDFSLRVMSGRHHVEVSATGGTWGKGTWVDAAPGARRVARAGADGSLHALPSTSAGDETPDGANESSSSSRAARRTRRAELDRALLSNPGTRRCMSPLEKRDLVAGSFIVFDIGIDADGTQAHLNVADSNVPPEVERCLRRVVDGLALPSGPAATLRYRLAF